MIEGGIKEGSMANVEGVGDREIYEGMIVELE